jgi:uncharacterized protein YegL
MTDIVRKPDGGDTSIGKVSEPSKKIKLPGISQRVHAAQERQKEVETKASEMKNRLALVLDTSGSMSGEPIELLKQAVTAFCEQCNTNNTSIALVPFPYGTKQPLSTIKAVLVAGANMLHASGGTPMGEALSDTITNIPITRAILISDGCPDSEQHAYTALVPYIETKTPVDTVHIGLSESGEEVLRTIAARTGGIYMKFKDIHTFVQSFSYLIPEKRGLLTAASDSEIKRLTGADDVGR